MNQHAAHPYRTGDRQTHHLDGKRAFVRRARRRGPVPAPPGAVRPLRDPAAFQRAMFRAAGERPELAVIAFNRAGFGLAPGDLEHFRSLGVTDAQRMTAWVDRQLDPASIADTELESRLAASNFTTLGKTLQQLWRDHWLPEDIEWDVRMRPFMETQAAVFLRAVYSKRQLSEVLADFWHNHFNIYGWHDEAGPLFVHWDRDVIRANMLGNFRRMIEAVTAAPSMLFYLDNAYSTLEGPNENYARELMELHTMGEEHYMGAIPASRVPVGTDGVPVAYVDEDVREMARCLTGWTINPETGEFLYREEWHDTGAKHVLGLDIPADLPAMEDVRRVLDRLATHPGTARFICTKLCRRLVADDPPEALVEAAVASFLDNASAPDQLARVFRTILLSEQFAATWGAKVKRPFELVVSAMRAMNPDFTMDLDVEMTWWILWVFSETGQGPYEWRPPTGYPDVRSHWLGTNPLVMGWRMVNWLSDLVFPEGSGTHPFDVVAATPGELGTAEELANHWIARCLGRPMDPEDRRRIVEFMAQGHLPTVDLGLATDESVQSRLRTLAALILTSPEALER